MPFRPELTFLLSIDCVVTSLCTVFISRFSHILYNIFCCCCDIIVTGFMGKSDKLSQPQMDLSIKIKFHNSHFLS